MEIEGARDWNVKHNDGNKEEANGDSQRITCTAQESLRDDRNKKETYSKTVEKYVEKNYPYWLTAFHMVPDIFTTSGKQDDLGKRAGNDAELRVYCRLHELGKDLAKDQNGNPMFIIHSFTVRERNQRGKKIGTVLGEFDFVIVSKKYGLIFLELKASDKFSKSDFDRAKDQIKKSREALSSLLKLPAGVSIAADFGFVMMPNCQRPQNSKEPYKSGCFKEDCQDGKSFRKWWDQNIRDVTPGLGDDTYKSLLCWFIGIRSTVPAMGERVDSTTSDVLQMFDSKQLALLDNIGLPLHQLITGPAGSGKTSILLHKVRALDTHIRKAEKKEKILVLCYNRPLEEKLTKELKECSCVTVRTFDSILHGKPTEDVDLTFDHIFVDEGQDLTGKWRELLEAIQKKSICERKFRWIFFDNHQLVRLGATGLSSDDQDKAIKLNKVYRMTRSVYDQFKKYVYLETMEPQCSIGHNIRGMCIEWDKTKGSDDPKDAKVACNYISERVKRLLDEKVEPNDICVLVRDKETADGIIKILKEDKKIACQDATQSIKNDNPKTIIVESIRRFKGLETKVLILYNPHCPGEDKNAVELLYTAFSRSFCHVIIIAPRTVIDTLQSEDGGKKKQQSPFKQHDKRSPAKTNLVTAVSALEKRFTDEELTGLSSSDINTIQQSLKGMIKAVERSKTPRLENKSLERELASIADLGIVKNRLKEY
ncbi:PREDICTED: uncharacterized protein LOC109471245 [Branchiostoma belcheri]|uniref:Uncharacterized protein LOC109471245 n=1 Tax=Branchiostoma belcheri TaxID=7741 RepID=A0A6P4YNW2_BRABE|nr:PREDICTED: uncharacterized protein LOC109471245 [Branchiostoma belcheri]